MFSLEGWEYHELTDMESKKTQILKRQVGVLHLTGLGVGYINNASIFIFINLYIYLILYIRAVISGDFFGWNYGLDRGGFGGLLLGIVFVGLYFVFNIKEYRYEYVFEYLGAMYICG